MGCGVALSATLPQRRHATRHTLAPHDTPHTTRPTPHATPARAGARARARARRAPYSSDPGLTLVTLAQLGRSPAPAQPLPPPPPGVPACGAPTTRAAAPSCPGCTPARHYDQRHSTHTPPDTPTSRHTLRPDRSHGACLPVGSAAALVVAPPPLTPSHNLTYASSNNYPRILSRIDPRIPASLLPSSVMLPTLHSWFCSLVARV